MRVLLDECVDEDFYNLMQGMTVTRRRRAGLKGVHWSTFDRTAEAARASISSSITVGPDICPYQRIPSMAEAHCVNGHLQARSSRTSNGLLVVMPEALTAIETLKPSSGRGELERLEPQHNPCRLLAALALRVGIQLRVRLERCVHSQRQDGATPSN